MAQQPQHFDSIIIGAGQGGIPLAKDLAAAGQKVALIEREHVGGSCVNYGCTPTKALISSAHAAHTARRAGDYGVEILEVQVNMQRVKQRRDGMVQQSREGIEKGLEDSQVSLLRGTASFLDQKKLQLKAADGSTQTLTADRIIINTGTTPIVPDISGLSEVYYFNYKTIQDLTEVPEHLVVIGGGYIGLEFGQMFRRFGSQVTLVQRDEQLLGREDTDVAEELKRILEEDDIRVLLKAEPQEVKQEEGIVLTVRTEGGASEVIRGTHLLLAVGVQASTADLDLNKAGIETDEKGNIKTDKHLHTSVKGVYAIGDVKGGPQFTHISYDDYRILRDSLLHGKHRSTDERPIPYCVFTEPQLGRVGLSEKEAKAQNVSYRVAKLPMSKVARGKETGYTQGFLKVLVAADTGQILGAAMLAEEGGELMTAVQLAMMGNLSYEQLKEGVFAHPTYLESLNNLFMSLDS